MKNLISLFSLSLLTTFTLSAEYNTEEIAIARTSLKEYVINPITEEKEPHKRELLYAKIKYIEKSMRYRINKKLLIYSIACTKYDENTEPIFTQTLLLEFIYFWDKCERTHTFQNFTEKELESIVMLVEKYKLGSWVESLRSINPCCIDILTSATRHPKGFYFNAGCW